jgi:hypothetical protein
MWKTVFTCVYIEKKNFFSRTTIPVLIKLGTNYSGVKEIQNCTNKGPGLLQRGDNHKKCKTFVRSLNFFPLENH